MINEDLSKLLAKISRYEVLESLNIYSIDSVSYFRFMVQVKRVKEIGVRKRVILHYKYMLIYP